MNMRALLWAGRATPQALTPEEVTSRLAPSGCGVTKLERPPADDIRYVPTPAALELELNERQQDTLRVMRSRYDLVEVDKYLPECGTAWVVATDYDDGARHIVHQVITREGVPI